MTSFQRLKGELLFKIKKMYIPIGTL